MPDESYPADFDFDQRPLNVRNRIYRACDVRLLADERIATMKPSQRAYEAARAEKAGQTLQTWVADKLPRPEHD